MIVVGEASIFIALERIRALDLLPAVYGEIHVPSAVWHEVFSHSSPVAPAWVFLHPLIEPISPDLRAADLDPGETEALQLARHLKADLLLMDEAHGRAGALRLGLRVDGVLGILATAKQRGKIPAVAPYIHSLRTAGFWLGEALVTRTLQDLGES